MKQRPLLIHLACKLYSGSKLLRVSSFVGDILMVILHNNSVVWKTISFSLSRVEPQELQNFRGMGLILDLDTY